MPHLDTDRLAAIADDTPTAGEATHLAGCWDCRAELAAFRRLVRMSAMAPVPMEPLTSWSGLAPHLRAEGIIADALGAARGEGVRRRPPSVAAWAMRVAAGLTLLVGGVAAGRMSAGLPLLGRTAPELPAVTSAGFQTNEEALQALTVAQQQYQSAAAFLAAQDTSARFVGMNQDAYQTRLAALDEIAAAARSALYRTPQDQLLNQYYLTTLGAREATLRQIGATLPATRRLERY
ncbi:MAG: hypothetical protein ACYC0B_01235 [Gemmatimonadaceae bacterium]